MIVRQLPGKIAWCMGLLAMGWLLIGCSGGESVEETAVPATTTEADHEHKAEAEMI